VIDLRRLAALPLSLALAACGAKDAHEGHDHAGEEGALLAADTPLGIMTSLPLLWPLDASVADIAGGSAPMPWIGARMEERFNLVPLDTLSPIAPLNAGESERDPLAGLMQLAVIQPRALTPADNVALDEWVRAGGHLLLVLDPALTGHYDLPLGDPRLPNPSALVPPVMARWGLEVRFNDAAAAQPGALALPAGAVPLAQAGEIVPLDEADNTCAIADGGALAVCAIGKGRVTVLADAAVFEHDDHGEEAGHAHDHGDHDADTKALFALLDHAFPNAQD
jgi:hypothetical protein